MTHENGKKQNPKNHQETNHINHRKEVNKMTSKEFINASTTIGADEIPSFNGSEKEKASDYANYFCSYAQLYHQKQMLADHNRMAAYHSAIMGNPQIFKDKVVMDVGTGSGILAVWAAQAGARIVYALEYTDMAKHAQQVMEANGVDNIVKVIQGAVEDLDILPGEGIEDNKVDIIISEWMGYFLLRESMLDTIIRARDKFLKKDTGLMFPSHCTMYVAPIRDEDERRSLAHDHNSAMSDWHEFVESTHSTYNVDMSILQKGYEREQREYYLLSSRWTELPSESVLADPVVIKKLDMITCTIEDSKGIITPTANFSEINDNGNLTSNTFKFELDGNKTLGPISGLAGWFTADFKSRTDEIGLKYAPKITNPALLCTAPDSGYTHWGQQTFYFLSSVPLLQNEITVVNGCIEMNRCKDNSRLYDCRIKYSSSRSKKNSNGVDGNEEKGVILSDGSRTIENVYQIP